MKGEPELQIKMLGGFRAFYGQREIFVSLRNKRPPKYLQFLFLLWLRGKEGVSWDELSEYFFPGKHQKSMYNSINNLVHNARRALLEEGLPEENYYVRQGRMFFADPLIPYSLDVFAFEGLIEDAREARGDPSSCYQKAFDLYGGALLPEVGDAAWVLLPRKDLKKKYLEAGEMLLEGAKTAGESGREDDILSRALMTSPDPKWEAKKVESLLESGRLRDAAELYESVVLKYARTLKGIRREKLVLGLSFANENILSFSEHVCDILEEGKKKGEAKEGRKEARGEEEGENPGAGAT